MGKRNQKCVRKRVERPTFTTWSQGAWSVQVRTRPGFHHGRRQTSGVWGPAGAGKPAPPESAPAPGPCTTHRRRTPTTMTVLYPSSADFDQLDQSQLALKIARHSHCSTCGCTGLKPALGVTVALDNDDDEDTNKTIALLAGYDSDDSEDTSKRYLRTCDCGHDVPHHGADKTAIGDSEFARRGRVAVRLDELLQVSSPKKCNKD